jgi:hypothetical protein
MNGYICLYRGKKIEVRAATTYEAQLTAAAIFKARNSYQISVYLAEIGDNPVIHDPAILD